MKAEPWQKLDELFPLRAEREPGERPAFLDEACAGDEALRKQVEVLLAANQEAGSFIESPASPLMRHRCLTELSICSLYVR